MHVGVLLQITAEDVTPEEIQEVFALEKQTQRSEQTGFSLAEGKAMLAEVQVPLVRAKVASWVEPHRSCDVCGTRRKSKGSYPLLFRTFYGDVPLQSPRLHRYPCKTEIAPAKSSPLPELSPDHVAQEKLYLESRWASLVPYAATAGLLGDVSPIASGANASALRQQTLRVAGRVELELGEERTSFIDGCPGKWASLPVPEGRIVVGLDGGYARDWKDRKTNFELIVGRTMPEDRESRYIGTVHGYDGKSKRRLFDLLNTQCLQANQSVTFLTDGGEEVRSLTELITPEAEHGLDWFQIAMRITVLEQYAHSVGKHDEAEGKKLLQQLERIKWLLWHGDQHSARQETSNLREEVAFLELNYQHLNCRRSNAHEFSQSTSTTTPAASSIMENGAARESASLRLWRRVPSTPSLAKDSPNGSKCNGPSEEHICFYRPAQELWTERSDLYSNAGILAWPSPSPSSRIRQSRREPHTCSCSAISGTPPNSSRGKFDSIMIFPDA